MRGNAVSFLALATGSGISNHLIRQSFRGCDVQFVYFLPNRLGYSAAMLRYQVKHGGQNK